MREKTRKAIAIFCGTIAKTITREVALILAQIVNLIASFLLHVLYKPGHYMYHPTAFQEPPGEGDESPEDEVTFTRPWKKKWRKKAAKTVGRAKDTVVKLPRLFRAPSKRSEDVRHIPDSYFDKLTTGLFEDLYYAILNFINSWEEGLEEHLLRLHVWSFVKHMWHALAAFHPKKFQLPENMEIIPQIIREQGYPCETIAVETEDNYWLKMHRIPKPESRTVVYLQHGVMDTAYGWVCCGNTGSFAFMLADRGCDIFMGNFRGMGESYARCGERGVHEKDYWNVTFDDLAQKDYPAFMNKIRKIKQQELGDTNFKVILLAHSMGAGGALAFLAWSGLKKVPHHVDLAILLAPAGIHLDGPAICKYTGRTIDRVGSFLRLPVFRFDEPFRSLAAKLWRDLHRHPGTRELLCCMLAKHILGGSTNTLPLYFLHNMMYHLLLSSVSFPLFQHFWQFYSKKKFEAFDYGKKENLKRYGSETPLSYLDNYDKIDVPVKIVAGTQDALIPEHCIRVHYDKFQEVNPTLAHLSLVPGGHIDITMGINEATLSFVSRWVASEMGLSETDTSLGSSEEGVGPVGYGSDCSEELLIKLRTAGMKPASDQCVEF